MDVRFGPMFADYGLAPGVTFAGRYQIERLLKRGGMGAVYAVRHVRTKAELALKIMRPEVVGDPTMRERFAREAQVSSIIKSAHVVTVIDADVDATTGMPFLVMELLRGHDLAELSARGPMPPNDVIAHLAQAARGLDRAHALGIVHRDLKPENLFLATSDDEAPKIKILDFGIAKIVHAATAHGRSQEIGTPLYMAPEQMSVRGKIGPWTDVWALGLTAFTLLVGRPYWEGESVHEIYGEILRAERQRATTRAAALGVTLPAAFDAWFSRCTDNVESARFASAGEAIAALSTALAGAPVVVHVQTMPFGRGQTEPMAQHTSAPSFTEPKPRPTRVAPGMILAGAVVGLATVTVVVVALRTPSTPEAAPTPTVSAPASVSASAMPAPTPKTVSLRARLEMLNPFVEVGSASLQRHEVTREEVALFVASLPPSERTSARPLGDWKGEGLDEAQLRRPATWMSFVRASRFCAALDARLPKLSELRKALAGKRYPWGNAFPPPGTVMFDRPHDPTLPDVESAPTDRTATGIHDLFGSVREWTSDVQGGFAAVWGVASGTPASEAVAMFATPSLKEADDGEAPLSHVDEIAGAQLGFRCAR